MNFIRPHKRTIVLFAGVLLFSSVFSGCTESMRQKKVADLSPAENEKKEEDRASWYRNPPSPNHLALAEDLMEKGYFEVALVQLDLALASDGKNARIYNLKGVCEREAGDEKAAAKSFKTALDIDPENASVCHNMGILYYQSGKADLAEACFEKAIALDPGRPDFFNNYGVFFMSRDAHEAALVQFEKALHLDPGHEKARNNLAITLGHLKQYNRAMKLLLSGGSFETACYNMGCIYRMNGEKEKSRRMFLLSKGEQEPFDRQIMDKEAPRDPRPPEGLSGDTGNAIYQRYLKAIESGGE